MPYCRITVFASKGKRHFGYDLLNPDNTMEKAMSRLPGSGSSYWPDIRSAFREAYRKIRTDQTVHQIKIETISGVELCRIYERGRVA